MAGFAQTFLRNFPFRPLSAAVAITVTLVPTLPAQAQEVDVQVAKTDTVDSEKPEAKAAETIRLRYRFEPNQTLKYETKQTIIQTGVAPYGEKVETNKIEQRRVFTITDVEEEGSAQASMQFEYVRMERDTGTADPISFDTNMEVSEVPQFFRAAARNLKSTTPKYQLEPSGTPVTEDRLEKIPKGGQATFIVPLPSDDVAIGDTWTTFIEVKIRLAEQMFRTVKLRRTYRLKAVENGIAEIGMATSAVGSLKDPRARIQLLQATPTGTIWFDVDRGVVTKKEIRVNKTVMNAMGPKTMVSAKGRTVDRLL